MNVPDDIPSQARNVVFICAWAKADSSRVNRVRNDQTVLNLESDSKLSHSKLEFVTLHQFDGVVAGSGSESHVG